jgi:hypothetical protein
MVYSVDYITVIGELKRVRNVFAVRRGLESPFVDAPIICIRAFLFYIRWQGNSLMNCGFLRFFAERLPNKPDQIHSFKRSFLCSLRVYKRIVKSSQCRHLTNWAMTIVNSAVITLFHPVSCRVFLRHLISLGREYKYLSMLQAWGYKGHGKRCSMSKIQRRRKK